MRSAGLIRHGYSKHASYNSNRCGEVIYIDGEETEDKFALMDLFYRREKEKEDGYNEKQCLKMFGCSKSGYHAWLTRMKDEDGKRAAKLAEEQEIIQNGLILWYSYKML